MKLGLTANSLAGTVEIGCQRDQQGPAEYLTSIEFYHPGMRDLIRSGAVEPTKWFREQVLRLDRALERSGHPMFLVEWKG